MHTEALHMSQISCSTELCWGYLSLIVTPAGPRLSAVPCLSDRKEITTPLPFFIVNSVLPAQREGSLASRICAREVGGAL